MSDADLPGEDDRPPPLAWLVGALALAVLAAAAWLGHEGFRVVPGPLDRYAADRAAVLERGVAIDAAGLAALVADPLAVRAGARLFADHCARCHGAGAEGLVGPNLTDRAWLGGGEPLDVYATIVEGRVVRGMPPWGSELGPARCKQVTAFVLSLRDTDVPGRPPEGAQRAR